MFTTKEKCPVPLEVDEERNIAIFWDMERAIKYASCLMEKDGKYHAVREERVLMIPPKYAPLPILKEYLKHGPPVQYVVSHRGIKAEHLLKMVKKAKEKALEKEHI